MKKIIIILFFCVPFSLSAQEKITIMQYNLTYYGNTSSWCDESNNNTTDKNGYLNTIIGDVLPDILGVNELGYSGALASELLNDALNTDGRDYFSKSVLNGFGDIANLLYYNKNKFGLYSEDIVDKEIDGDWITRAIDIHTLYYKAPDLAQTHDTIFLSFIVAHLKAGSDASDEIKRDDATKALMNHLDVYNTKGYKFFMGDFNIKSSNDNAYQNLIDYTNSTLNFVDPINRPGNWSANSSFKDVHTQSTRSSNSNGGCFVTGGLDDRYDLILMDNIMQDVDSKVKYVQDSYKAFGNDGNNYNTGLNISDNGVVSETIAQALYDMSDHLPVIMEIEIESNSPPIVDAISELASHLNIVHANPLEEIISIEADKVDSYKLSLMDVTGRIVLSENFRNQLQFSSANLNSGIYFLKISNPKGDFIIKKVVK